MRKAGSWIALVAGIFTVLATIFTTVFSVMTPVFGIEGNPAESITYAAGGFFVSAFVIILSIVMLNVRSRFPAFLLVALSVLAIWFNVGGGFVTICLVFAIIGCLMVLFSRKPSIA